jgi:hypothetical protein
LQGNYDHGADNASGRPRSHTLIRPCWMAGWQVARLALPLCSVRRSILC